MNTLVTGGTGMIGRFLVDLLLSQGHYVRVVSLDDYTPHPKTEFLKLDLTNIHNCMIACDGIDAVFHLAGIKGSPKMAKERPASFFYPTVSFNTNMLEAARIKGVKKYLYTSSIGVYSPDEVLRENDVWKTFPSENDKFAGWSKRLGELQCEAYKIEYGWNDIYIVRPANVYGPYDNFDPENGMVIPSLIRRVFDGENPIKVWGDGTCIRDFIYAEDVAHGMVLTMNSGYQNPVNLGSFCGTTIKDLVNEIISIYGKPVDIVWDVSQISGDYKRVLDDKGAKNIGFIPKTSLREGLKRTINWYLSHKSIIDKRFNIFR